MSHDASNDIWITEVEAVNFQSLKHLVVKLINGNNAFIGESNSGKTAMIRAIRWCLLNKPNGDYFITTGEKEAMVRVSLSNGKEIERRKSTNGVNLYRLYHEGELIDEYTGFGTSVPEEVVEAHGIRPISGDIYFQFSQQLESAFLLSLRPSKRAEVLGAMEELRLIDSALSGINEDIRNNGKTQKELTKNKKQLAKEIKTLILESERAKQSIETLKSLKKGLEKKMSMRDYLLQQVTRLRQLQATALKAEEELVQSQIVLDQWPTDLEERYNRYKLLNQQVQRLREIKEEVDSIQRYDKDEMKQLAELNDEIEANFEAYHQLNQSIKRLKVLEREREEAKTGLYPEVASLNLDPLEKQLGKYKLLYGYVDRLRQLDKNRDEIRKSSEQARKKIDETLENLVSAIKDANICPTCGQETHGVCTEHVETTLV